MFASDTCYVDCFPNMANGGEQKDTQWCVSRINRIERILENLADCDINAAAPEEIAKSIRERLSNPAHQRKVKELAFDDWC